MKKVQRQKKSVRGRRQAKKTWKKLLEEDMRESYRCVKCKEAYQEEYSEERIECDYCA